MKLTEKEMLEAEIVELNGTIEGMGDDLDYVRNELAEAQIDLDTVAEERDAYEEEAKAFENSTIDLADQTESIKAWLWAACDPNKPYSKAWDLWLPLAQLERNDP